ncbi:hypothetical protein RRG08_011968 [Elysia crispata]|uniref:Chitin-binding type-2 domain-containing protein n=1 Tax=Elysia crispata TaxID=231223 RepID=A0AAE0ZH82_9GAST|nr:hypothetical protein RRG08_011968 [Elysia crispata]
MQLLDFLIFVGLVALTTCQNTCPPTEVLFLLDESENARIASSTNADLSPFDILQNSIRNFLQHPLVANSRNDFRVGAISYSSGTDQRQVIPPRTGRAQALTGVTNIGRVSHAGSWTYRGLEVVDLPPMYANSVMIVISSQGSGNQQRQSLAQEQINRVSRQLGWRPYVIVPQGPNQIDMTEMTLVNNGQPPVVLYDQSAIPQGYRQLDRALNTVIEQMLCTTPPTPPPANVCPPTEVMFVLDESENAHNAASTDPVLRSFDILQDSIRSFLQHPRVANSPNDFRVGAVSYSSGNDQIQVIPVGSSPRQALTGVNNIGRVSHAGSWTYRGLEYITTRPRYTNSILIVISSQGSGAQQRRNLAQQQITRVARQLGWRPYVIAAQGVNAIDMVEMTLVNMGQNPVVLTDQSQPPQGYRQLTGVLNFVIEQILCNDPRTAVAPPTTTTTRPTTRRPTAGICNDCLYEAGYGFDFDPNFCDSYYMCVPNQAPIRKACPAGTFWSGSTCDFIENVNCAVATCIASTPAGTRYPSGRCCNKYFECASGTLSEMTCPNGQVFSLPQRACVQVRDTRAMCDLQERYICDVTTGAGGNGTTGCGAYSPDPFGNPCRFMFGGYTVNAPQGTMWSQTACSLVFANTDQCGQLQGGSSTFFGDRPADVCNAVFLATFDNGQRTVYSERQRRNLEVAVTTQEARLERNGLVFDSSMVRPYGYYFFFNNRAVKQNTAFRVRFLLDQNAPSNRRYDILSNNFCDLCPETVSITVTPRGRNQRDVNATFVLTNGQTVTTSATINTEVATNELEVTLVVGETSIYGQVSELRGSDPNGVIQTESFTPVPKPSGVEVQPNRCGFMLGQGPNSNFIGLIDDFAVFEYCSNINQVLRQQQTVG